MSINNLEKMKQDFNTSQPISSFYPIKLSNGATISEFCTQCSDCRANVPDENFRGMVSVLNNGNTISNRGVGFCKDCLTLWNVEQRTKVHQTSIRMEYIKDGRWVTAYAKGSNKTIKVISTFLKFILMPFGRG